MPAVQMSAPNGTVTPSTPVVPPSMFSYLPSSNPGLHPPPSPPPPPPPLYLAPGLLVEGWTTAYETLPVGKLALLSL